MKNDPTGKPRIIISVAGTVGTGKSGITQEIQQHLLDLGFDVLMHEDRMDSIHRNDNDHKKVMDTLIKRNTKIELKEVQLSRSGLNHE